MELTWEELEAVGIDRNKCRGFQFNTGATTDSAETLAKKQEVWNKILEMCNGSVDLAKKTLQKHTAFGDFTGHTDINKVKEAQLKFLADKVEKAYKELESKGIKSLIIDLRNNGGGLVDQCLDIAVPTRQ